MISTGHMQPHTHAASCRLDGRSMIDGGKRLNSALNVSGYKKCSVPPSPPSFQHSLSNMTALGQCLTPSILTSIEMSSNRNGMNDPSSRSIQSNVYPNTGGFTAPVNTGFISSFFNSALAVPLSSSTTPLPISSTTVQTWLYSANASAAPAGAVAAATLDSSSAIAPAGSAPPRVRRRRMSELPESDIWHCPYAGCPKKFSKLSRSAIADHRRYDHDEYELDEDGEVRPLQPMPSKLEQRSSHSSNSNTPVSASPATVSATNTPTKAKRTLAMTVSTNVEAVQPPMQERLSGPMKLINGNNFAAKHVQTGNHSSPSNAVINVNCHFTADKFQGVSPPPTVQMKLVQVPTVTKAPKQGVAVQPKLQQERVSIKVKKSHLSESPKKRQKRRSLDSSVKRAEATDDEITTPCAENIHSRRATTNIHALHPKQPYTHSNMLEELECSPQSQTITITGPRIQMPMAISMSLPLQSALPAAAVYKESTTADAPAVSEHSHVSSASQNYLEVPKVQAQRSASAASMEFQVLTSAKCRTVSPAMPSQLLSQTVSPGSSFKLEQPAARSVFNSMLQSQTVQNDGFGVGNDSLAFCKADSMSASASVSSGAVSPMPFSSDMAVPQSRPASRLSAYVNGNVVSSSAANSNNSVTSTFEADWPIWFYQDSAAALCGVNSSAEENGCASVVRVLSSLSSHPLACSNSTAFSASTSASASGSGSTSSSGLHSLSSTPLLSQRDIQHTPSVIAANDGAFAETELNSSLNHSIFDELTTLPDTFRSFLSTSVAATPMGPRAQSPLHHS